MPFTELSLREKKYATQKLNILDMFAEKIKEKSLAETSVKEVAKELDISEMTFFNYFGSKKEVLIYFIELWSLEMQLLIEGSEPLDAIYLIFEQSAKTIEKNPNLFMEIVASMALYGMAKKDIKITQAERVIRFGVDTVYNEGGFQDLMMPLLRQFKLSKEQELFVYTALYNTYFATPLLLKCPEFTTLQQSYVAQLDFILKEIR